MFCFLPCPFNFLANNKASFSSIACIKRILKTSYNCHQLCQPFSYSSKQTGCLAGCLACCLATSLASCLPSYRWMRSSRVLMRSSRVWMISIAESWMRSSRMWMRYSRACGWDLSDCGWDLAECGWNLAKWLERLTANAEVATVLASIPASSDTVKSEGRQMKQCWILYIKKKKSKKSALI